MAARAGEVSRFIGDSLSRRGSAALCSRQDDCIVGHQCTILSLATMSFEEREELVESAERTPFADDNCLCDSITEPNFAECAPGTHEGNSPYPCYGAEDVRRAPSILQRLPAPPDRADGEKATEHRRRQAGLSQVPH